MKVLRNSVYVGDLTYGRRDVSKFNERNGALIWRPKAEWITQAGAWDPIVDRETWETVQRSFGGPVGRPLGSVGYPLSGLIKCEACASSYYGHTRKMHGKTYFCYVHRNPAEMQTQPPCKMYVLPRDLLEDFVFEEVKKALVESDIENQVTQFIRHYTDATTGNTEAKLIEIDRQLAQVEEKEGNVRQAMESGVEPAFVVQSLKRLQQERADLQERRADLQSAGQILRLTEDDIANICCAVGQYLEDLEKSLEHEEPGARREMLRSIVDRIVVDRPANLATAYIRRIPDLSGVTDFMGDVLNENVDNGRTFFVD